MRPSPVRRSFAFALSLTLEIGLLAGAPLLLALASLAQALGHPKPMIALRAVLAFSARELGVIVAGGALWCLGPGRRVRTSPHLQRLHWRLLRWFVHGIAGRVLELLEVEVSEESSDATAELLAGATPVIVLSRHAGPGDTLFLIDRLIEHYGRRPSVVLRQAVALDPAISLLTARLPHGVIDPDTPEEATRAIERLAAGLQAHGALLIYPEGGNFTRERRHRALRSLRRRGKHRIAGTAEKMVNVLPPQPAGVLAALRGHPSAPVVIVAHTGLGLAAYPREIYRELPRGGRLRFRTWVIPRAEVPAGDEERVAWLNQRWQEIDRWVRSQQAEPPATAGQPA